jgi:hypothetical protein
VSKTKIRVTITLENSEEFTGTDTCEEEYLTDIPSNQLDATAKSMTQGFRRMMEVMRRQEAAQNHPTPAADAGPTLAAATEGRRGFFGGRKHSK